MKIEFHRKFFADAAKLPPATSEAVKNVVQTIEDANQLSELIIFFDCKPLKGVKNAYRIRKGDYRILFIHENNTIYLRRVICRGQVYKKHNV